MAGKPSTLTAREKELFRLLKHTVQCFDPDCSKCIRIEGRVEDGPEHFPEDHALRMYTVAKALRAIEQQAIRVADFMETAPVSSSAHKAAFDLTDMTAAARRLLTAPIYNSHPYVAVVIRKQKRAVVYVPR